MRELDAQLPQVRAAWITGGSALPHCPPAWREALGEGPAAEAALAALTGHAMQTLYRPTAPAALTPRPLLPTLNAPAPPAAARGRLRRLLAGKADAARVRGLVQLLARRGYVMHPADWTPGPGDDWAPAVYAPWLVWAAAEKAQPRPEALTLATYDDWSWAERRAELAALRQRDAAAAGAIIAAKALAEPAERRLKLVEILENGLGPADVAFLESLAKDRSDRVQAEARRLLARLGHGASDAELTAELAAMVEFTRTGLIRRRGLLKLKPLKTQAQQKRRNELLALVSLGDLARALGATEETLLESAPEGEALAVLVFVNQVADTGSDTARTRLLDLMLDDGQLDLLPPLAARLSTSERAARLAAVVARDTQGVFATSLAFAGDALGGVTSQALTASPAYRQLVAALRNLESSDTVARQGAEAQARAGLTSLGLLLDPAAAEAVIRTCTDGGLSPADPALDLLHFNAALKPERPT